MGVKIKCIVVSYLFIVLNYHVDSSDILCETGFCRIYGFDPGCDAPAQDCSINNATHSGMWMLSPTTCNCCDFCLPFFVKDAHCSLGGPGLGTTVGRCGNGLTCVADPTDGMSYCKRLESDCHKSQDDYDERHAQGIVGALENRPLCDGKGRYGPYDCVPTQTCFCQSEEGERLFGEVLNLGAATAMNLHCGCSRLHAKIRRDINPGVPHPVIGPRCTSDGNFHPIQCIDRTCYCVHRITGVVRDNRTIDLDEEPMSKLPCYNPDLDLFPSQNEGEPPYNYTTPCYERMQEVIDFLEQSEEDGYNVDFFSSIPECLPDGTFGRISRGSNSTKICVDERNQQIEEYQALPGTPSFDNIDCKCAQTAKLMTSSPERPVCCNNGNFRTIQCRRGLCRCVDSDGRQYGLESDDPSALPCYKENWRDLDSKDCYSK